MCSICFLKTSSGHPFTSIDFPKRNGKTNIYNHFKYLFFWKTPKYVLIPVGFYKHVKQALPLGTSLLPLFVYVISYLQFATWWFGGTDSSKCRTHSKHFLCLFADHLASQVVLYYFFRVSGKYQKRIHYVAYNICCMHILYNINNIQKQFAFFVRLRSGLLGRRCKISWGHCLQRSGHPIWGKLVWLMNPICTPKPNLLTSVSKLCSGGCKLVLILGHLEFWWFLLHMLNKWELYIADIYTYIPWEKI